MGKETNHPWRKSVVITAISLSSVAVLTFMTLFIYYAVTNFRYNYPTITFDADGGTLELYDDNQVKFPITNGEDTWRTFYPKHNYFGATKEGYDFLCWSIDGDYPVDNNYVFNKSITLKPIYVKNRDCVTISCRFLDNNFVNFATDYAITFSFDGPPPYTVKCATNGGDFENYTSGTNLSEKLTGAGDYFSFKISDGIPDSKHFNISNTNYAGNKTRFAVSGPIDALTNKQDYPNNAFSGLFDDTVGYPPDNNAICSARGLDLSGHPAS